MMWLKEMWTWIQENVKLVLGVAGAAVVGLGALVFSRSKDKTIGALIDDKIDADKARADKDQQVVDTIDKFQKLEDEIRQEFENKKREMNHNQKRNLDLKKKQYLEAKTEEERAVIVEETEIAFEHIRKIPVSVFAVVHEDEK